MVNLKDLRGRIQSIGNISQITKAMEMVASMKLRKVQAMALSHHPYAEEVRIMIERIASNMGAESGLPWFRTDYPTTTGILLITSDRGLCGSYNANMFKALEEFRDELHELDPNRKLKFYCYGRKGYTWLTRRGYDVERFFVEPPLDKIDFNGARMVAEALAKEFRDGAVDSVRIMHTAFRSMVRFEPINVRFLPVMDHDFITVPQNAEPQAAADAAPHFDYLMEPDAKTLFDILIPRYLETMVFDAMLQSLTSEHASRRMAMKGATDAAGRMVKDLRKVYNKARQESITMELLDIVGGAEAVA